MSGQPYKYWAFISYSHQDQSWANWLHKSLETYRVPRRLVGREHWSGPLPRRLMPIFRDRDELPSSAELGSVLNEALQQSRYLIVICSPQSARSRWVNEEVKYFKSLGRAHHVLPLIVGGEPHASGLPSSGLVECLPQALRFELDENGALTDRRAEPIAADARGDKDGRANARLKLIAGLLGVGLDELKRRERQRQIQQRILGTAATAALLLLVGLGWNWQQNEKQQALEAQALKVQIDQLYENGREELLAHNEARAAVYLNEAYKHGVDTPALRYMLARAMRVVDAQLLRVQIGSPVIQVALSPDGKRFLAVDRNYRMTVWNAETGVKLGAYDLGETTQALVANFSVGGKLIWVESNHSEEPKQRTRILTADGTKLVDQFTPGGGLSYTALPPIDQDDEEAIFLANNLSIVLRSLKSGRSTSIPGKYSAVRFCGDRNSIVAGDVKGNVSLFDHDGNLKKRFTGLLGAVSTLEFGKGCKILAAGTDAGALRTWDVESGRMLLVAGHAQAIDAMQMNAQGTRLMSRTRSDVDIWNGQTGALLYARKSIDPKASSMAVLSPDGDRLIQVNDSRLAALDIASGAELYSLDAHQAGAQSFDFSAMAERFISGGADGSVVIWNLPRDSVAAFQLGPIKDHGLLNQARPPEPQAKIDLVGKQIAVGGNDGAMAILRGDDMTKTVVLKNEKSPVTALAFDSNGARLAIGNWNQSFQILNTTLGKSLTTQDRVGGPVSALSFAPKGDFLSVAVQQNGTTLRAVPSGKEIGHFDTDSSRASSFNPKGGNYALGIHGAIKLWDLHQSRFLWATGLSAGDTDDASVRIVKFSPDGSKILAALAARHAYLLDAHTGKVMRQLDEPTAAGLFTAAFSSDGESVALGDYGRAILLWDIAGNVVTKLLGHSTEVKAVAFSPDGALLASASADGMLKTWEVAKGELLDTISAHAGAISWDGVQFNSLGDRVLTVGADDAVRLWDTRKESRNPEQIAALLRCRVAWKASGSTLISVSPESQGCSIH